MPLFAIDIKCNVDLLPCEKRVAHHETTDADAEMEDQSEDSSHSIVGEFCDQ